MAYYTLTPVSNTLTTNFSPFRLPLPAPLSLYSFSFIPRSLISPFLLSAFLSYLPPALRIIAAFKPFIPRSLISPFLFSATFLSYLPPALRIIAAFKPLPPSPFPHAQEWLGYSFLYFSFFIIIIPHTCTHTHTRTLTSTSVPSRLLHMEMTCSLDKAFSLLLSRASRAHSRIW